MEGRDELLGIQPAAEVRPLQPVLDQIARRMLFIVALFTPFFLLVRLAPLLGGNIGEGAVTQLLVASVSIGIVLAITVRRRRYNASQIGWVIAVLAAIIGLGGVYRLGTNSALTSFIFLSLMSLALFVGRRPTLIAGVGMWLFAIVMTLVRNMDQLQDTSALLDVKTGIIGVGSGFFSGIMVVILIAEVLPTLLRSVERAMSQRSEERQRRWYAEARSEQVQTRWQSYFENAPVGLTLLDGAGNVVGWSKRNEEYMGVSNEQMLGQPVEDYLRQLDADHALLAKTQAVLAGHSFTGLLMELATERGIRTILVEGDPLFNEDGSVDGAVIVGIDVTPLIDSGDDPEESHDKTLMLGKQNALATLSSKLLAIRSALMTAGLSAETLNTELSGVAPNVANLLDRASLLADQQRDASRLADDAFALLSDAPEREVAQRAAPLAEGAAMIFRSRAEKEGIALELDDAFGEGAFISAPPVLVRQILINLISNAREAIGRSDKAEQRRIVVRVAAEADAVVFMVEDTAGSVLPVNRDVYFNPAYSTKGEQDGSGKGLYVSRHTAERLGGSLDVEQGDQGLRFVLTLPRRFDPDTGE